MEGLQFCPLGGMDGVLVTMENLTKFAIAVGSRTVDERIPLPNVTQDDQMARAKDCAVCEDDAVYWETDEGNHGWCCRNCGDVIQWG